MTASSTRTSTLLVINDGTQPAQNIRVVVTIINEYTT